MFVEFFALGAFGFWALVLTSIFFLFLCVEKEWGVAAVLNIGLVVFILEYFGKVGILALMAAHPIAAVVGAALYCFMGAGWSLFRWRLFSQECLQRYFKRKVCFLKNYGFKSATKDSEIPAQMRSSWTRQAADIIPAANNNKARLTRWIAFWPWSLTWFLIDDSIRKVATFIYLKLITFYNKITEGTFKEVAGDLDED